MSNAESEQALRRSKVWQKLGELPRARLANLPTPLHFADRVCAALGGPKILIKRDDLTGLATGGNKARKLEYLFGEAVQANTDCVITAGGPQSNHCRQTAAAANRLGLRCHLVIGGSQSAKTLGNLLLDHLLGADIHWTTREQRDDVMEQLAADLRSDGHRPYVIPVGGSNGTGALGYVHAILELLSQLEDTSTVLDHVVFATSSGGTHAGLILGARLLGFGGSLTGISIDQTADEISSFKYREFVAHIANAAARRLGVSEHFDERDIRVNYDYLGAGYGVVGELERAAICSLALHEGILLGPVYTGRAFGALMELIRTKRFSAKETVLFWHTGDETALHAYADELV
jgi:D-cysteine desulfhydrase